MKPSRKRQGKGIIFVLLSIIKKPIYKKLSILFLSILLVVSIGFLGVRYFENRAFQSRVNMKELRSFITYVIQDELNKAVDLGIIGFNLVDGVIIEDLVISQEEDFSNSKKLLHSKKVALKLSSIFSNKPYIKKIQFVKTKISIDIEGPFFSKFVDYLRKINIQEVEFIDSEIEIRQGDQIILNWAKKTHWIFKQTDNIIDFQFDNGIFFIPFLQKIRGKGKIELNEDKIPAITLDSEWKNIQVDEF
ncbi:MAG: hypothetical protein JJT78_10420, partial [Leptospira sp.]|nr:hypothetical protein [Leptospira sp.]